MAGTRSKRDANRSPRADARVGAARARAAGRQARSAERGTGAVPAEGTPVNELGALLAVTREAIALVDANGTVLASSEAFARLLGGGGGRPARLADALGSDAWAALHRAAVSAAAAAGPPATAAPERTFPLRVELATETGPRAFDLRVRRVAGAGGAIAVALHETGSGPEERAAGRRAAPRRAQRGRLARGAAHELANLLVSIQFASDALLRGEASPAEARDDLTAIREAAEHAGALLRRLQVGSVPPEAEAPCDLGAAVTAFAPLLERLLPPRGPCTVAVADAPLRVRAGRERIEQVLANLALPADDAAPASGTFELHVRRVTLGDDAGRRGLFGAPAGIYGAIVVRDAGAGAAALHARLAEDEGLGLPQVRALVVDGLGGDLAIEDAPEGGALVTVYLPLASDDAAG